MSEVVKVWSVERADRHGEFHPYPISIFSHRKLAEDWIQDAGYNRHDYHIREWIVITERGH